MSVISLVLCIKNLSRKRAERAPIVFSVDGGRELEVVGLPPDLLVVCSTGAQFPSLCTSTEQKFSTASAVAIQDQ